MKWLRGAVIGTLVMASTALGAVAPRPRITLLHSPATSQIGGWRADWEWKGARQLLQGLGMSVNVVESEALVAKGCSTSILVLANCRNLEPETVDALKAYVKRGGKLLATYQSSYRQADNRSWTPNNFALSAELGVRFSRWVGGSSECARLQRKEGPDIGLLRHQAMLVELLPGAQALAMWDRPDKSPAVVQGPGGIYCGEDLLAPENAQSPEVRKLLATYLTRLDPKIHLKLPAKVGLPAPEPPLGVLPNLDDQPVLRVGMGSNDLAGGQIRLRAHQGQLRLGSGFTNHSCREIVVRTENGKLMLHPSPGEAVLAASDSVVVEPLSKKTYIDAFWESREGSGKWQAYRGRLELLPTATNVTLTNVLPLDAYLVGVVPSEVPSVFPDEALKAMAVVARSFVLAHLDRHKAEGFDVCSEVHCQVYRGLAQEAGSTNKAVAETLGEVLLYQGKTADATFHACCGGYGVDVEAIWPRAVAVPYLRGVPDFKEVLAFDLGNDRELRTWLALPGTAFCSSSGRYRWEEKMRWSELENRLEQSLSVVLGKDFKGLGMLKDIRVEVRDVSGRVTKLVIEGQKGTYSIGGDGTRWLTSGGRIGAGGLNSSLFVLDIEGTGPQKSVHFRGAGWGHGVGLCQEGAAGRAKAGHSYAEILAHYYRGSRVVKDPPPIPTLVIPKN